MALLFFLLFFPLLNKLFEINNVHDNQKKLPAYSQVSQILYRAKNVTLASERYTTELLYIYNLDIGSYKTAV